MFTGKTINMGVIGNPISHSLSPAMQNAGIQAAGLDYAYIAMPVRNENLGEAVAGLKALGFRGFNVTIPPKQATMEYLDEIHEDAKIIGAVNAVKNDNGHLIGYNTDVTGFIDGMKQQGFSPAGRNAVLLGAGGAARAIIWGLIKEQVKSLTIGEAVSYGWQDVINILALITINLGIVNLLPLPALDGGKALLVLAEAILHRPVPTKWQMAINAAGMAMLFALMIFATWQDILRIF